MQVRQSRINVIPPDASITRNAAVWKSKIRDLSLADCYALATTQERAQVLVTTDPLLAKTKGVKVALIELD